MRSKSWIVLFLILCVGVPDVFAGEDNEPVYEKEWVKTLRYRPIGPFRGGRSAAVCGVPGKPMTFYFGATGGGVWKTTDGGNTWKNVSDGYFGGSIGAVAVSTWDPNVIYVGGGEVTVRGNVSHGSGLWKSTDAGKTWKSVGLKDTHHIPRVRIHPKNPDVVYVAALGHLHGPNEERGVFRSQDGGKTWKKILYVNKEVGACDLLLDPNNPRIIYASTWRVKRTPYSLESGGEGSGLWKSTDGGDTWKNITRNKGLPKGTVGIIGVAVSPVNSSRVWAIVEAKDGGVFRSSDAGETWTKINDNRSLRQRAWYYTRIYAGPKNIDEVYVVNVRFWRSNDGGKNFSSIGTPHGDHHDLWIDPEEPDRMIIADDGGGQITYNRGKNWTTYLNQPTAQFYRVTTDNHFPYRIYGAQQDNSTVRILSRSSSSSIGERHWEPTAGGESGHIAPHPKNPDIVYGGSYAGFLTRIDHKTGERRAINVWPDSSIGHGAGKLKYRFQWNFPIFFSPHDSNVLYAAGNALFKSTNEGQTWVPISPDLTLDDKAKQKPSGGPITKDNTTVEYYCTIFAALECPHEKGVLWCGSDDGLIHISRDGGKKWKNVTPPDLPKWTMINSIEAHPTIQGGLYVAGTRYRLDDFRPYLYKTTDYGKTWKKIVKGIPDAHFTRVIRADPKRAGLLYAGTENGMYVSFDDGENWRSFQLNLPIVPITDLALKNDDLIVATQGRSFWVLDDLTPLHQLKPSMAKERLVLLKPRPIYRMRGGSTKKPPTTAGQNPPSGVVLNYYVKELPKKTELSLEVRTMDGEVIRRFSTKPKKEKGDKLVAKPGMNQFVWNMRYPNAESFKGLIFWGGGLQGPLAVPGTYQAKLALGKQVKTVTFEILPDPRSSATTEDFQKQFDFLLEIRDKLTATHRAIKRIRDVREQIDGITKRLQGKKKYEKITKLAKKIKEGITKVEEALYQTKNRSRQDPLNFPIRLNNKIADLGSFSSVGDKRPTDQAVAVKKVLFQKIDAQLKELAEGMESQLPELNRLLREAEVPGVFAPAEAEASKSEPKDSE